MGWVYFIRAGQSVKIGYTSAAAPAARMPSLQTGSQEKLQFMGAVEGTQQDERRFHEGSG